MRVLLIKTSSMGDIIHTLPALTDAGLAIPGIKFDWVLEEGYAEIPPWHPQVNEVFPMAWRRWRKGLFSRENQAGLRDLYQQLNRQPYDLILDAQGLMKSALLCFFVKGLRVGLDFKSARESLASFAYQRKCTVNFYQHAVVRMRSLFSQALAYPYPKTAPNFGLYPSQFMGGDAAKYCQERYLVFLHGTTWTSKLWPENYWVRLAELAKANGYRIKISGGTVTEVERAKRIAALVPGAVDVLPYLNILQMAQVLVCAKAAVAVDTGFGHLAAALNVPTVSLYGSTNPSYTSAEGAASLSLAAEFPCSPCLQRTCTFRSPSTETPACYTTIPPERVWTTIQNLF